MTNNISAVIRRRLVLLLGVPLLAVVATLALPSNDAARADRYRATDIVAVDQGSGVSFTNAAQASLKATKGSVAERAAKILGSDEPPLDLAGRLKIKPDDTSFALFFTSESTDPAAAKRYVEAFAKAFVQTLNEEELAKRESIVSQFRLGYTQAQDELDRFQFTNQAELSKPEPLGAVVAKQQFLQQQVVAANQQLQQVLAQRTQVVPYSELGSNKPVIVPEPTVRVPTSRPARALLALVLAGGLVTLFVVVLELLNPRVDDRATVEEILGVPVLAVVPLLPRRHRRQIARVSTDSFTGPFAEAFRLLRSHLAFIQSEAAGTAVTSSGAGATPVPQLATGAGARVQERSEAFQVLVVSAAPGEGKTSATAFLSLACAQADQPPVAIDADTRRPSLHRMFSMPAAPGLSNLLRAPDSVSVSELVRTHDETGIHVLPGGSGSTLTAGLNRYVGQLLTVCRESGRSAVIDTTPVLVSHEALDLLPLVDQVVVVVRAHRTPVRSLRRAVELLELHRAKVSGALVIGTTDAKDASSYYYSYEYQDPGGFWPFRRSRRHDDASPNGSGPASVPEPRPEERTPVGR